MSEREFDTTEEALEFVGKSIRYAANVLGVNNAATQMGALEVLAMEVKDSSQRIAESLESISSSLDSIAAALGDIADNMKRDSA